MSSRPITLLLSNIPWDFVWQRHQTLGTLLAREHDVVFCEIPGIRRIGWRDAPRILARLAAHTKNPVPAASVPAGVRVVRPFVLPATNRIFHRINVALLRRWLGKQSGWRNGVELIWNYSPSRSARWLIEQVPHGRLVYDCTDDWQAVWGVPYCVIEDERWLLARADLTLVPSRPLLARKQGFARRIERVPHGALVERFRVPLRKRSPGTPITLLYYGHLHAQHLNFAAIDRIARERPAWRIVLVGPVKTKRTYAANVALAGQQPHEELQRFVAEADVLILPYALNAYTAAVLPAKIYECLATGRPVVAAPLPELVADFQQHLRFASRPDEWVEAIEAALREDSVARQEQRKDLAFGNRWEDRYAEIQALLSPESSVAPRDAPILSIIIVAYKSRDEIGACVASLPRELGSKKVEVIVVDNSPGDGAGEVVRERLPHATYIPAPENLGFGRANNLGYAKSRGEFVLFLNPDTVGNDAALAHCVKRLRDDAAIGLISPKLVQADGSMDLACRRSIPTLWDGFCRASGLATRFPRLSWFAGYNLTHLPAEGTYEVGAINGAFMMAPRRVLEAVAPDGKVFDEAFFMYGDDLDLCIRVARAGFRIVYDGRVQITHLKGTSVAKDFDAMSRAIFDANRAVYLKHFNPNNRWWVRWKYTAAFGIWKRVSLLRARWSGHRRVRPV